MGQPYVGEIRMFAGTFAPLDWLLCQGQVLPIAENETLYQLIGTTYGGDGQTTFALPNLTARFPLHYGSSSAGSYPIGTSVGTDSVTLLTPQIPSHTHLPAVGSSPTTASAAGAYLSSWADVPYSSAAPSLALAPQQLAPAGGSQPHENRQPYVAVNFIISLAGVFPSQS
ncbi:phage tail protein [Leifsonia sp. NPDC058194]|uniref:phage tail protein n=1 Tax=Leifsonia sp. NPDC058194 TaxID=3346374 RepID=UPI0036D9E668